MSADNPNTDPSDTSPGEYEARETGDGSYEFVVDSQSEPAGSQAEPADAEAESPTGAQEEAPKTPVIAILFGTALIAAAGIAVVYWTMSGDGTPGDAKGSAASTAPENEASGFRPYQGDDGEPARRAPTPTRREAQASGDENDGGDEDAGRERRSSQTEIIVLEEEYDDDEAQDDEQNEGSGEGQLADPVRAKKNRTGSVPVNPNTVRRLKRNIKLRVPPEKFEQMNLPEAKEQPVRERETEGSPEEPAEDSPNP